MAGIKVTERIPASADAVWGLLRDFGGVTRFSKEIERCTVEGEGVGAVRSLTLPGGICIKERLEAFDDGARCLEYSITEGPLPLDNYLARVQVTEDGRGCQLEWSSTFQPKGVPEQQANGLVEGIYRGGIQGIKKALGV